jgi:hypothetical protein
MHARTHTRLNVGDSIVEDQVKGYDFHVSCHEGVWGSGGNAPESDCLGASYKWKRDR